MSRAAPPATRRGIDRRTFLRTAAVAAACAGFPAAPGAVFARAPEPAAPLPGPLAEAGGGWRVSFEDDFQDLAASRRNWIRVTNSGAQHRTLRVPRNVVVSDGDLRLRLGHRQDEDRPFTGGFVRTRTFRQRYGYFECDLRIADEPGVNNAFWLVSAPETEGDVRFELDVVEAKYPDVVQVAARRWRPDKLTLSATRRTGEPLAAAFHRYAMLWTEKHFRFFFDGEEIYAVENRFAHTPAELLFSNAVAPFAGKTDGDVAGAATAIGRVRVYEATGDEG